MNKSFLFLLLIGSLFSCNQKQVVEETKADKPTKTISAPVFNGDSAYQFVKQQVDFGPRVANSKEHDRCAQWMISELRKFADTVYVQDYETKAFDHKILKSQNIIASFNPQAKKRILLTAHWDTRPFADQDSVDEDKPILGANDAGSGVGILMEMARAMHAQKPDVGVDIVLFDSEDYGQPQDSGFPYMEDSYCLGSQYWAAHPHVAGYKADFGINLDMAGAKNSVFTKEQTSIYYADWVSQKVWQTANRLGYGAIFSDQNTAGITDDHLYVNKLLNIPTIDIIHYDFSTHSGFGSYWHTHRDNMDVIDKNILSAVGSTLLQVVYE